MNRYLKDCAGNVELADALYSWNIAMAGAVHEALHVFEVLLRNAIDRELRVWNSAQNGSSDWLLKPSPYLTRILNDSSLAAARSRAAEVAQRAGRPRLHDDVLAQMSLGTWRYILPSNSSATKRRIWNDALSKAFPLWPGPWQNLVTRVKLVHDVRNRVAHLEPLHGVQLRHARRAMRDICNSISVPHGRMFVRHERMLPLIEAMPVPVA